MNRFIQFDCFRHLQKVMLMIFLSFFINSNVFAGGSILSKYGYTIDWMLQSEIATDIFTIDKLIKLEDILSNPTHLLLICSNNDVNASENSEGVITITSSRPTYIVDNKVNSMFTGSSIAVGVASASSNGTKNVFAFGQLDTNDDQIKHNYYTTLLKSIHQVNVAVQIK